MMTILWYQYSAGVSLVVLSLNLRRFLTGYTEHMIAVKIHILLALFIVILLGCEDNSLQSQPIKPVVRSFKIPVDEKLNENQVLDYIAIRKKIIRKANARYYATKDSLLESDDSENSGENKKPRLRYFDEIEQAVAETQGMSYTEYLWIKDTIITTQTQLWLQQYYEANARIIKLLDGTLSRYREIPKDHDKQEQNKMKAYVKEMKQELKYLKGKIPQAGNESEAFIYNSVIVSKYQSELESLK